MRPMTETSTARPARRLLAVTAALALTAVPLSACSNDEEPEADTTTSVSPETPSATTSVAIPEGVEVTEPGTQLAFGDSATVAYEIRDQGTVLEMTVDSAAEGALKDFVGFNMSAPYQKTANYYYVRVSLENVGEDPLNGVDVPLWGISGENTLLPLVKFTSSFKKCPTEPLPDDFGPGDTFKTCLVFLSPDKGTLEGVSYRPVESYDPIEWRGQVEAPPTTTPKKGAKGKKSPKASPSAEPSS